MAAQQRQQRQGIPPSSSRGDMTFPGVRVNPGSRDGGGRGGNGGSLGLGMAGTHSPFYKFNGGGNNWMANGFQMPFGDINLTPGSARPGGIPPPQFRSTDASSRAGTNLSVTAKLLPNTFRNQYQKDYTKYMLLFVNRKTRDGYNTGDNGAPKVTAASIPVLNMYLEKGSLYHHAQSQVQPNPAGVRRPRARTVYDNFISTHRSKYEIEKHLWAGTMQEYFDKWNYFGSKETESAATAYNPNSKATGMHIWHRTKTFNIFGPMLRVGDVCTLQIRKMRSPYSGLLDPYGKPILERTSNTDILQVTAWSSSTKDYQTSYAEEASEYPERYRDFIDGQVKCSLNRSLDFEVLEDGSVKVRLDDQTPDYIAQRYEYGYTINVGTVTIRPEEENVERQKAALRNMNVMTTLNKVTLGRVR